MDARSLGAAIRARRQAAGMRQRDLAAAINTQQSHVSELERGVVAVQVDTVARIAEAVGCRLSVLFMDAEKIAVEDGGTPP